MFLVGPTQQKGRFKNSHVTILPTTPSRLGFTIGEGPCFLGANSWRRPLKPRAIVPSTFLIRLPKPSRAEASNKSPTTGCAKGQWLESSIAAGVVMISLCRSLPLKHFARLWTTAVRTCCSDRQHNNRHFLVAVKEDSR